MLCQEPTPPPLDEPVGFVRFCCFMRFAFSSSSSVIADEATRLRAGAVSLVPELMVDFGQIHLHRFGDNT